EPRVLRTILSERLCARHQRPALRYDALTLMLIGSLCSSCAYGRLIESSRQSEFLLCERSATDDAFPKYPRLPVLTCPGWEPRQPTRTTMRTSDLLLTEFDAEMKTTRTTLERVPAGRGDFTPHAKSMPLGRLAPHVAELAGFGLTVLTEPGLDFSQRTYTPLPFESAGQLVRVFDEGAAKVRGALQRVTDGGGSEPWKLAFQGKTIFEGSRFMAYRQIFLNHIVHHRAQLGVYLRLNGEPVPATYGPSADETLGF